MKIIFSILMVYISDVCGAVESLQTQDMRDKCRSAQTLEKSLVELEAKFAAILQKEKVSAPALRNAYNILARCFTTLFSIQRFSEILTIIQKGDENNFVRASILIKNFTAYFRTISAELNKWNIEIANVKSEKKNLQNEINKISEDYNAISEEINQLGTEISGRRVDNVIQKDVVYHIAHKAESIEELDAELEAENTVGVLKNTKVSTDLSISYPVNGTLVNEFGDKGDNGQMIYYMAFRTRPGAIVTSPADGQVVFAGKFLNFGNMIIISNGEYRIFLYGITNAFASTGDVLAAGDYIGKMGSAEDTLIRMELKKSGEPLDPRHWLVKTLEKEKNV